MNDKKGNYTKPKLQSFFDKLLLGVQRDNERYVRFKDIEPYLNIVKNDKGYYELKELKRND